MQPTKALLNNEGSCFTSHLSLCSKISRKGLQRFLSYVVNHPVIKEDGLLAVFLSEPDFESWRRHTSISLDEESTAKRVESVQEMSIPSDLEAKLASTRQKIGALIEHWTRLCATAERILKRREAAAGELARVTMTMNALAEGNQNDPWGNVGDELAGGVNSGVLDVAGYLGRLADAMEERSKIAIGENLEALKVRSPLFYWIDFGVLKDLIRPNVTSTLPYVISFCDTTALRTTTSTSFANASIRNRLNLSRSRHPRRRAGRSRRTSSYTPSSSTRTRFSEPLRDAYSSGGACGTSFGLCCVTGRIHFSHYSSKRGLSRREIILRLFEGSGARSWRVWRVCHLSKCIWPGVILWNGPLDALRFMCSAMMITVCDDYIMSFLLLSF